MFNPAKTYDMSDAKLNQSRMAAMVMEIQAARNAADVDKCAQKIFWFLAALWNGNRACFEEWHDWMDKEVNEAWERVL